MLKMDLEYKSGILFIRLNCNLIRRTNYKINNYIMPILVKHKIKYVIYNFKKLKSIDESGIDAILNTKCQIKRNRGIIYLCEVNCVISKIIKRLKIKQFKNEETALKKLEVKMWTMKK